MLSGMTRKLGNGRPFLQIAGIPPAMKDNPLELGPVSGLVLTLLALAILMLA